MYNTIDAWMQNGLRQIVCDCICVVKCGMEFVDKLVVVAVTCS